MNSYKFKFGVFKRLGQVKSKLKVLKKVYSIDFID
ncbi:hypothetical protein EMGBS12_06620, partial [Methylophilaceae bacterium]